MATYMYGDNTDGWQDTIVTDSGTMTWGSTDPYNYHYVEQTEESRRLNFIPDDAPEGVEPIQGEANGARYLVSYAFIGDADPVVFLKGKGDMVELVKRLLKDEKVDKKTILVHRISSQFRPKLVVKKKKVLKKFETVELNKVEKKKEKK